MTRRKYFMQAQPPSPKDGYPRVISIGYLSWTLCFLFTPENSCPMLCPKPDHDFGASTGNLKWNLERDVSVFPMPT